VASLAPTDDEVAPLKTLNLPVGVLGTHHPGLFSVRIDDVAASRLAVNHLLDLGHRRITAAGANSPRS
jgi:DNA-binding LacI/PurR family transcriptional regulator